MIVSFKLNQDQIAMTMCVNRDKPEMHCNGKCVLAKRLKAQQDEDSRELPQKLKEFNELVYFIEPFSFPGILLNEVSSERQIQVCYLPPCSSSWIQGIFHPPRKAGSPIV